MKHSILALISLFCLQTFANNVDTPIANNGGSQVGNGGTLSISFPDKFAVLANLYAHMGQLLLTNGKSMATAFADDTLESSKSDRVVNFECDQYKNTSQGLAAQCDLTLEYHFWRGEVSGVNYSMSVVNTAAGEVVTGAISRTETH